MVFQCSPALYSRSLSPWDRSQVCSSVVATDPSEQPTQATINVLEFYPHCGCIIAGAKLESRMVHIPRRAVPEHLNRTVVDDAGSELPLLGLDDSMHTLQGASAASSISKSDDSVVEEELVAMPIEAV
jgi:hypothetical protein